MLLHKRLGGEHLLLHLHLLRSQRLHLCGQVALLHLDLHLLLHLLRLGHLHRLGPRSLHLAPLVVVGDLRVVVMAHMHHLRAGIGEHLSPTNTKMHEDASRPRPWAGGRAIVLGPTLPAPWPA